MSKISTQLSTFSKNKYLAVHSAVHLQITTQKYISVHRSTAGHTVIENRKQPRMEPMESMEEIISMKSSMND